MYRLMCLLVTLANSLAADVTVYKFNDYYNGAHGTEPHALVESPFPWTFCCKSSDCFFLYTHIQHRPPGVAAMTVTYETDNGAHGTEPHALVESPFPWTFCCKSSDCFFLYTHIQHRPPGVAAMTVTYETDVGNFEAQNFTLQSGSRPGDRYYVPRTLMDNSTEIKIVLNLYTSNNLRVCSSLLAAKGRRALQMTNETTEKQLEYFDACSSGCVLVVNLKDKCKEGDLLNVTPSKNDVLIYVISSVIVMCLVILVIFISVKKYCHRNLQPLEILELDTYITTNEVVYADLSLVHGDSQPPRRDEESTYAEIIGVMKPVDVNLTKK